MLSVNNNGSCGVGFCSRLAGSYEVIRELFVRQIGQNPGAQNRLIFSWIATAISKKKRSTGFPQIDTERMNTYG
jgi:hypothetical protein